MTTAEAAAAFWRSATGQPGYSYGALRGDSREQADKYAMTACQEAGGRDTRDVARDRVRKILASHYPRHISDATDTAIRAGYNIILPRERMQAGNGVW